MTDLSIETTRFREWAGAGIVPREGQWECDYSQWPAWHRAVLAWVEGRHPRGWSDAEVGHVLYAIARDNDAQYLVREIRRLRPGTLRFLARASLAHGEIDARWQLAVELGHLSGDEEAQALLFALASDQDEYVRRRATRSLAGLGVRAAEELAWAAWHRPDEYQEWARMSALECLRELQSPRFEALLAEGLRDERPFLRQFAERLQNAR
ncbi:HEAT repeat domain-containing protein [Lysobacter enzymogenes]|uniref:HEAT repeat domain-containing protein n=1 Tax=Lysobacter enzymogenes TaxID=69 RepID=UPI00099CC6B6|nr:HEAT repeat domain-containing protein [Lysobacter enzymogenes]UZW61404.1 HEAT repeat domain-containing protein [Lysobacter enzymogenes]